MCNNLVLDMIDTCFPHVSLKLDTQTFYTKYWSTFIICLLAMLFYFDTFPNYSGRHKNCQKYIRHLEYDMHWHNILYEPPLLSFF